MISTRGRYAIRVMIDLAENCDGNYIPLKDVAERQGISLKYLERILPSLTKTGMLEGVQGKGGGYRLKRNPDNYKIGEILRVTEKDLAPVECLSCDAKTCTRETDCRTLPMWKEYRDLTNEYFDGITIADLMKSGIGVNI